MNLDHHELLSHANLNNILCDCQVQGSEVRRTDVYIEVKYRGQVILTATRFKTRLTNNAWNVRCAVGLIEKVTT